MEILYLLIPMSAVLVLIILGVFGWAVHKGQYDDIEREGERILEQDVAAVDADQSRRKDSIEQSAR
ncbi:MAG: cbb3-type cytochrome oxidase assembly protein CcoS [Ideonella sp.]|jgi:cbb3-type cytochrome oxidase maturation protein|nr:cbb3-type cytochrome oxidase assembly protein CcoS [Ideonella sp.]MBL0147788.1 cbb3-type cytochrome oxidase assembly protein CcoS [Ideonella sp.]